LTYQYLLRKYGITITFEEAAEETGLYWQTVRVMCARGDIKTPRAGRKWILTTKALAEYLDGQQEKESNVVPIRRRQKYEKIV
jgi:excisionase family DNA binding protein